jgi:hypothetical protein
MNVDAKFRAKLQKSEAKGGWTYVKMPGSAKFFGTRGLVKVEGNRAVGPARGTARQYCAGSASIAAR